MPHVSFLIGVATAVTLGVVGIEVISGRASPGTLVAFVAYMGMLMRPIRQTGMLTASLVRGAAAGGRILDVINRESRVKQAANAYELPPLQGEISFENVEFSYQEGAAALEEIDFSVKPGELVAIVGPTGAGKTTLVHLIPRFYDPSAGRVLLDGHDVREVTLSSLRMQVGTVLQNVFLFSGTVKENIAFGRPEASFAEVRRAAELAQIHDEIQQLPQGYDTMLGERGAGLSGGQRQRLALARVLLTNPRVLILDEMSSELDAVTEKKLRDALEHAFRGRTTLVIAHRLWTIQRADRIVVLDAGKVVESGTHAELVVRGGLYKDIYAALVGKRKSGSAGPDYDRQDAQHDGRVAIAGGERR
jgi:ABC-type multidrug transport system fused ATPase/permease subunit